MNPQTIRELILNIVAFVVVLILGGGYLVRKGNFTLGIER